MDVEAALGKFYSMKLTDLIPSMTTMPVVTVDSDLLNVLKILRARHHVWVVRDWESMELVGIIKYLDVIDILLPPELHGFKLGMTSKSMKSLLGGAAKAEDVAEKHPLTIERDATVLDTLKKMKVYRAQVLAVVEGGKLVGEVSLRILIDELLRLLKVGGAQWKE
ncbi:CBS domain-containing protein [Thermococcus waiotapuensis]|uniref:CBS domain-containing protein n=1 Tax=Thermococcus waiotapuensis TaxID=90909 RepID=A0AAE4NUG7_9EURY|nr:CBS domain-containing protein [Thermococcus waiotapuensis]MDV3104069.1 CBS domain-containing protein [Thermococcus waiotapuensis]